MKVSIVGPAHPYKGGGARHTTELAHRLRTAGHDVVIESWRAQYPARLYPGQQTVDEPEGEPFPATRRRLAWYRPDGWFAAGRRLRRADLVVFALITPIQVPAYLTMLAALRHRARVVVICHNVLPHERRPGDVPLVRALLRRADSVVVHSAEQAGLARSLAPRTPVAVAALPPHLPVTVAPVPTAPDGPGVRLLFFGIVRPYKGLDVLLRALAEVPQTVTLTVAGEFWGGPAGTEKLIAELGIGDRVTLRPGYVPASEIPALFAAADVLVLPYREATASQNALLAFAHGVPVITTTAGRLAEHVMDGVNGITAAPGDADDMLRALRAVSEPATVARLRSGVRPVDPGPAWSDYLRALVTVART
ncbi:MAG TPA: glycosyltransferase [Streptosporangiaceae bacterium]|nr:glycosyltransferase [Streptosporangiaceae bacterium]